MYIDFSCCGNFWIGMFRVLLGEGGMVFFGWIYVYKYWFEIMLFFGISYMVFN